jgi:hypothetical protein
MVFMWMIMVMMTMMGYSDGNNNNNYCDDNNTHLISAPGGNSLVCFPDFKRFVIQGVSTHLKLLSIFQNSY